MNSFGCSLDDAFSGITVKKEKKSKKKKKNK